jgi:hypothetical protein
VCSPALAAPQTLTHSRIAPLDGITPGPDGRDARDAAPLPAVDAGRIGVRAVHGLGIAAAEATHCGGGCRVWRGAQGDALAVCERGGHGRAAVQGGPATAGFLRWQPLPLHDELVRQASGGNKVLVGCVLEAVPARGIMRARFSQHAHAVRALAALRQQGRAADFEYNDRAYDGDGGRGWCIAEQGACKAVAAHLRAAHQDGTLPERFRIAETRRPKVIELGASTITDGLDEATLRHSETVRTRRGGTTPEEHLDQALVAIERANFTGKSDKSKVQQLLANLEWLIRGAVEEDAANRGLGGRTIDPAILRRRARTLPAAVDDGIGLLALTE